PSVSGPVSGDAAADRAAAHDDAGPPLAAGAPYLERGARRVLKIGAHDRLGVRGELGELVSVEDLARDSALIEAHAQDRGRGVRDEVGEVVREAAALGARAGARRVAVAER